MRWGMNPRQACCLLAVLVISFVTPSCSAARPRKDPYAEARVQAVAQINAYRAKVKLPPLAHWNEADSCSDEEARKDSKANEPHKNFGSCDEMAQNECPDWPEVGAVVSGCLEQMWDEGPGSGPAHGHYINMTNPKYTKVSIGFYTTPKGKVWSVQNFK